MNNVLELPYVRSNTLGAHMIGLPYKGKEFGLFVLLPYGENLVALEALEQRLSADVISDMISKMKVRSISLSLPRLELEYRASMVEVLGKLGICTVFNAAEVRICSLCLYKCSAGRPVATGQSTSSIGRGGAPGQNLRDRDWHRGGSGNSHLGDEISHQLPRQQAVLLLYPG